MARKAQPARRRQATQLGLDEALIALCIAAMDANGYVAREELARAHHLIWSAKRFRRKSGETVGRLIARMKRLVEDENATVVLEAAAKAIPRNLRPSAFALVADLLLADGRIDARERRWLTRLATTLDLDPDVVTATIDVILLKNRL